MALDDAAWTEIRRLYCDTTITVREITERFRITSRQLYARRVSESWPKRSDMPADYARGGSNAPGRPTRREALVNRLYAAIDEKLKRLEKRMKSGEASTVADSERETRELSHMIRSFEKVTEVAADITKPAATGQSSAPANPAVLTAADAERMRHEIAERLERLHRGRAGAG